MSNIVFTLASQSPARLLTLRSAGLAPKVIVSNVDEDEILRRLPTTCPKASVCALAEAKALAVIESHPETLQGKAALVAADSMLEIDGKLQGKPHSAKVAIERWQSMNGRTGILHTGHVMALSNEVVSAGELPTLLGVQHPQSHLGEKVLAKRLKQGVMLIAHAQTKIFFSRLSESEIEAYANTQEPLQVAGAFTVDGLGGAFVEGIEGDPHSVVGISLPLLRLMGNSVGVGWHQFWE